VARTVEDAGLEPMQSLATAQRQDWAADQGGALPPALLRGDSLDALLDALLALRPPR
jgi:hypothetical protein